MNKNNKMLGLAMRIAIIVTWVMTNISVFVLLSGFANFDKGALDPKNPDKQKTAQEVLKIIGDLGSKTTLYYVTFGLIAVCLALAVISRYKTPLVSFIFKIVGLGFALLFMGAGMNYIGALSSCKGLSNLTVNGTSTEAVQTALSSAGFSGDAAETAKILTNQDELFLAIAGYIFPIIILFILTITPFPFLILINLIGRYIKKRLYTIAVSDTFKDIDRSHNICFVCIDRILIAVTNNRLCGKMKNDFRLRRIKSRLQALIIPDIAYYRGNAFLYLCYIKQRRLCRRL